MYRVIVVDDEYWAMKSIVNTFPWDEFGFDVVQESTNATQVMALIDEYKPDVVFSDVCMPVISGIELLKKAKEREFVPQFVFVSGYDDYQFLRQVIVNQAFDYCLKPIDADDAREVLKRLKGFLDENSKKDDSPTKSREEILEQIANREFKQMIEYINGHFTEKLQLKELAKTFFLNENYCCLLFNKYFNMSFSRYLNILRTDMAARLLTEDRTISIENIAERTGYTNYHHFIKVFKSIKEVSPSQYRKNNDAWR